MKRSLTLTAIVSIIFFNVSGGPYGLESVLNVGPGLAMLLILLTPLLYSAPVAFIAAELGTAIPEEGGYYVWSKRALGKFPAFCQGWWAWMFTFVDVGICPALFCDYLAFFFKEFNKDPEVGSFWARKTVMLSMIWLFVLLNMRGARTVGNFAKGLALMILSPFLILIGMGLYRGFSTGFPLSPITPFWDLDPGTSMIGALAIAVPAILWNYQGWDAVSTCAGEMQNPRRDYPRALLAAIVLITAAYGLPALIGLLFFGSQGIDWTTGAWSVVANDLVGPWLGYVLSAMGMVAGIGLYSGLVLVYSRVPFVMSRDGYLPKAMRRENKYGAPTISLLVCGVIYSGIVMIFNDFEEVAKADVTLYTGKVSMEMLSFLVLRWREPELVRPFRVPGGWPVAIVLASLPLLCIIGNLGLQIADGATWKVLGIPLCMMATGPLMYPFIMLYRRSHPVEVETHDEALPSEPEAK